MKRLIVLLLLLATTAVTVDAQRSRARRIRARPTVSQSGSCDGSVVCIQSVTGTISTGTTVTVAGFLMEQTTKTNWDGFFKASGAGSHPNAWSFEGASPTADFLCDIGECDGTYQTTVKLIGSKAIKWHQQGAWSGPGVGGQYNAISTVDFSDTDTQKLCGRYYGRWDDNSGSNLWAASHIKMFDTQPINAANAEQFYLQPSANSTFPNSFIFRPGYDPSPIGSIPTGTMESGRWYLLEFCLTRAATQRVEGWIDNTKVVDVSDTGQFPSHVTGSLNLIGIVNLGDTTSSFNVDVYMDGWVISHNRVFPESLVEVAAASDFSGTVLAQQMTSISDTSLGVKLNLPSGAHHWMRVTNNAQATSAAFQLD